ncbi:uncharacterized protein si:ch73-43g23.1 [Betta splendens]|uniref:Uncharacterized protein si:ch73-43g23.1 n=1 Tax=Betta splendens TaxID=158456 RepID=A0A6P7NV77_BETSP|nr:uncharacterized protein si:ch73-43g23.1 [Betta splendens]
MDSWTLQGDSYSFLHSAPRTFSLCHREGTPNHVEIFDIINVPTQRSAISETTCLCDIFGDDCESPSVSSSPAVGVFVPTPRGTDGSPAASPLVDELNDSSGSYHTAPGSSEGEEGFEDSRERLCSPLLQNASSERKPSEGARLPTGHADSYVDTRIEPKSNLALPELNTTNPSPGGLDSGERTLSPGYSSPNTSSEGRVSSLSSSLEKRLSPSSPCPRQVDSETERENTPTFKERDNTPIDQSLTPSTSSESRNYDHPSSPHSVKSSPEFVVAQVSPELSNYFYQQDSPFSEPTFNNFSTDCTDPSSEPSPEPSPTCEETSLQSRENFPELSDRPESADTQQSSPFPEQRGRISLPDLFSRGSSPDLDDISCSAPSPAGGDCSATPENAPQSPELVSVVSSPGLRYTPSPAVSLATSAELMQTSVSPTLRHKTPSPGLLSAASSCTAGTRTPSPKITHVSTSGEIRTQGPSPVTSYSLPQSPEVRSSCSPRYPAPSPEIRVTGSSPEVSRRDPNEVVTMSASPLLETHLDLFSSRSPTSSPHITGISYTVVQPEDRDTTPFPELSHLSSPELVRTPKGRTPTPNRDIIESDGASHNSPHASVSSQSEISLMHPSPSPQAKPHTPSPEPTHKNPLSKTYQSPAPEHLSEDSSATVSSEQRFYQHSPMSLSTEHNLQYTQPNLRNTPENPRDVFADDITDIQYPDHLPKDNASPSLSKSEIKMSSPVQANPSPASTSPFTSEVKDDSQEREATLREAQKKTSLPLFSEIKQDTDPNFVQKDVYKKSPFDVKSTSPDLAVLKDKNTNTSPVNRASSPVHRLENIQPYSVTSEMNSSSKTTYSSKHQRRQLSTNARQENMESFAENVAHHVNRRRTPSPPLTRFTPVHIIAPEKPYRQWQNRSHGSSEVVAFSPSGKLKKDVTNRESPSASGDSYSHDHWVRLERQSELEQEMQLEDEREVQRERRWDREADRQSKREEQLREKGDVWQGDTSYRGEQVELSFNARNRKEPASRNTAPTSRETLQGLPAVHSYSESLPATRQLQQQQRLLRLASQQDTRVGGPSRRLKPSASQNKSSSPRNVASSRPCRSSSSSMGSELDEADNEVKWLTDVAFRSLSSPEVDYLDMYNSSHRSSTNISQPSTQESPAGVSASLLAYADFRGSAPKLDNDELSFQPPTTHYSEGLYPSRRYEMGSFECVDVAVEREDFRKVRKGVPKRQIQLKRKNNTEGRQDGSSGNSSPGVPLTVGSPSQGRHSREKFTRQHSTPAAMQECYPCVENPEPIQQNGRNSKLQKSLSLDETGSKTKMATCLIKSVLSKKMQSTDKQTDQQTAEEGSPDLEQSSISAEKDTSKPDVCILSSGRHLSGEAGTMGGTKQGKSLGVRSSSRPSSSSSSKSVNFSHTSSEEADSQKTSASSLKSEVRSELKVQNQKSRAEAQWADDRKLWDEREGGDSANAAPRSTGVPSGTEAPQQVTYTRQECENTEDHKQLQPDEYTSKSQEIASKAVEKKKTSFNVCLTPELENKPEASSSNVLFTEKDEATVDDKPEEEEEENGNVKAKVPIHKVRDVRRIVKNTYNLSFKGTTAASQSEVNEKKTESFNVEENKELKKERQKGEKELSQDIWQAEREEKKGEELKVEKKKEQKEVVKHTTPPPPVHGKRTPLSHTQPIQIEYKAVCKKESACRNDKSPASPESVTEFSRESQQPSNATIQSYSTQDAGLAKSCQRDVNTAGGTQESVTEMCKDTKDRSVVVRTDRKPPMLGSLPRLPSKEREVSTAVVIIRDGSSKTKTSSYLSQEDIAPPFQAAAVSSSPRPSSTGSAPGSSGHSVSMLLKEKGYQADIGAVMGDSQHVAGRKGVLTKHVNSMEIPLQLAGPAEGGQMEAHRQRTISSSSNMSATSVVSDTDAFSKSREDEGIKPARKETFNQKGASPLRSIHEQTPPMAKQKEPGDFEAVKRLDPTFPPRSPALRRFRPQPIEVKSLSKEAQKEETPSLGNSRPQTIEVKSIAKNSQKPTVPPKPICKFKPSELGVTSNEGQRPSMIAKAQDEEKSQTIVVSSPTIYRKISNESLSTSNYTRKLAVSTVSSLKPPPSKTTATAVTSLSKQSPGPSDMEACVGRGEPQQVAASPQSSRNAQRPPPASVTDPGANMDSGQATASDATANQIPRPAAAAANQPSQAAVMEADSQQQYTRTAPPQERALPATSNNTEQPQVPGYTHQSGCGSLSSDRSQRTDDLHFYTSDDPPSYDERESFSPLILPDLTPRRSNRYQPFSRPPPCSCTASRPSHPGVTPPHHHRSPHDPTPPAPTHSPGQALPYPVAQPPLRPHQCRPDHHPSGYQRSSPKSIALGPNHPPNLYLPLHQPPPCPPHPSLLQTCPGDRPLQPPQHIDPRRPPVHRSPQQQLPVMAGTHYNDPGHSHSPGLPPMDPQYLCGPASLGPSYGSDYGGDSSSLYSESSYGQTPRRVLMDPETGKYFYIEMPVQPLRKMLFDPETGQYVEVLIPQQAMSHSGLYPPAAAPYPSLHNPSMYASAPQYMPYAAPPPPPAHPQPQPQPPRYPEAPATATMHASGAGISYRNPPGQGSKPEPQNHPPLDQSYLESMYYVPTGMNASPNPTPPDYYHKCPPNLPPTGGKRS